MNLFNLKSVCLSLMGKTVNDTLFNEGALDLFLVAANNARKSAELLHNFEYARITATLDINGATGGLLSDAVITSYDADSTLASIKEVTAVLRQRPDGTYIPLDFARADIPIERDRTELELSDNLFPYLRYPSDAQINARGTSSSIVQRGQRLHIHPRYSSTPETDFAVMIEGYGWLSEYETLGAVDDDPADFLLRHGHTYLQWAIICELNYLFKEFVPRQEGNLNPPEKLRDDAWGRLLLWDSYMVDANTTRSR